MYDSNISHDDTVNVTSSQLIKVDRAPVDFPRVEAVLVRMTLNGFVQLAKAQARVYLANLRAIESSTHAVFTEPEARAVMTLLEFDRDEKGNNALAILSTLRYGTTDSKTVKRLRDAMKSGAASSIEAAIKGGYGKPPKTDKPDTDQTAAYLVRSNGERINLTPLQYAAVLEALKR